MPFVPTSRIKRSRGDQSLDGMPHGTLFVTSDRPAGRIPSFQRGLSWVVIALGVLAVVIWFEMAPESWQATIIASAMSLALHLAVRRTR